MNLLHRLTCWMTFTCGGLLRHAIARATIQPMNVQPRKALMTVTDPALGTWRIQAMTASIQ